MTRPRLGLDPTVHSARAIELAQRYGGLLELPHRLSTVHSVELTSGAGYVTGRWVAEHCAECEYEAVVFPVESEPPPPPPGVLVRISEDIPPDHSMQRLEGRTSEASVMVAEGIESGTHVFLRVRPLGHGDWSPWVKHTVPEPAGEGGAGGGV